MDAIDTFGCMCNTSLHLRYWRGVALSHATEYRTQWVRRPRTILKLNCTIYWTSFLLKEAYRYCMNVVFWKKTVKMIIYMFSEKHALINNSFAIIELFRVLTVIAKVLKNFLYLYNRFQNCSNTSFNVSNTHQLHWPTKYTSVALANKSG